jgi:CheY-like chemotaxis protein
MVDVTRDVRDQQHLSRLTEELRAALAKAEREQQLRARFLARMSHELRTPLTTIFSSFDLIHLTPLDAKQERYVDMARNAAVHLRLLIDNLFEYARVAEEAREHQDESFSLETVLSELVDRYAGAGRDRDIRVFADIAGTGGPLMRGDRAGLTRIVASLVENALKLAATGTIRLSGRVDPAAKDGHVTVAITVTSLKRRSADEAQDAPMPPPSEPVKGIAAPGAQRADSQIAVESLPGGGSAFTVTMDMRAAGPGGDSNGQSGNGKPMSELTVLLVEDQVVNQELISEMLATMGYTVVPVGTGEEALERASDTPFDAILMDRRLPGMDGFETAAKLRETMDPCPPIVLLTADASRLPREELERTPFVAFVTKPIDWATLDEEVRAAVAARGTS